VYYRGWRQLFHIHFDFTPTGRSHGAVLGGDPLRRRFRSSR
jgi:hypothetical protein